MWMECIGLRGVVINAEGTAEHRLHDIHPNKLPPELRELAINERD